MTPAELLDAELQRYRLIELAGPLCPEPPSPELILVSPPELAEIARALLPDPEPFDEWLRRLRAAEQQPVEAAAGDWEYAVQSQRRMGGALFVAAGVVNAALPVLLFILGH